MSFLEHLDELRKRIVRSCLAIVVGVVAGFAFINPIVDFILAPTRRALPPGVKMIYTQPGEAFSLYVTIALIMGIVLGILQEVNINRINLIFIPLLFCIAAVLGWIAEHSKIGLVLAVCTGLTAFVLFTRDYHGKEYRTVANREFAAGLLQAIDFAAQQGDGPICVTKNVHQPYIFVLFARQMNPFDYLPTIKYANPHGIFRQVLRLDRYRFGPNQCTDEARAVYILSGETPPQSSIVYIPQRFGDFTVYVP